MIKPIDIQEIRRVSEVNPHDTRVVVRLRLEGSNHARPGEELAIENDLKAACWDYLYDDISRKLYELRLKMSMFGDRPLFGQVDAVAEELEQMLNNPFIMKR